MMEYFLHLNLIRFLDFYFTLFFLVGLFRRFRQYQAVANLVLTGPGRWPRLLKLVHEHRTIFLTWTTLGPAVLALALMLLQLAASRLVWPDAGRPAYGLTVERLWHNWGVLFLLVPLGLAMLAVDLYGVFVVGEVDRGMLEKYFDQAEYWLASPTAHVVRVFTFGIVNPRNMVRVEVQKALEEVGKLINASLWWVNVQVALRFFFGLSLWLTWAFGVN